MSLERNRPTALGVVGDQPRIIDAFTQTKVKALEELNPHSREAGLEWATDGLPS
jgi:hypothetical protein